jgi:hypothetical protein
MHAAVTSLLLLWMLITAGCGDDTSVPWPDLAPRLDSGPVLDSGPQPDREPDLQVTPADAGPDAPPIQDNALPPKSWFWQGSLAVDRSALGAAFSKAGYTPPAGTFLLAARVLPGLSQPAFQYLSLGDSGFAYSAGAYWPASTVKLMAAVGALWTLGSYQLSGAASVSFADDDGSYSGTVKSLYDKAIVDSDNVAYNRLMEIAGFDEINDTYLVEVQGLPQIVLQRRYTKPFPASDLRTSPPISYSEGGKTGTIPQRIGTGQHPTCPNEGNCITLFELLDVMRRVALHAELPAVDHLPAATADLSGLNAALLKAPTFFEPGASQALGHAVQVTNKSGQVWDNDRLDHGLIVDTVTGERFLIAWSMPYNTTTEAEASELTRQTLLALTQSASDSPALQRDAGVQIHIQLVDQGAGNKPGTRAYSITLAAPGADALELWIDRWPLPPPQASGPAGTFQLSYDFSGSGERLVVVRAWAQGKVIGFRAARVVIAQP